MTEDSVKLPTSIEEAEAMVRVGAAWLEQHAPARLSVRGATLQEVSIKCDYPECTNRCGRVSRYCRKATA
jgi:hypothetical protein